MPEKPSVPAIVVHGGAGRLRQGKFDAARERAYKTVLLNAVAAGYELLTKGESSTAAVAAAVVLLEESELFNAGRGAVLNSEGRVELDASIMDGRTGLAGAVVGVMRTRNPVLLARAVMEDSDHVMLQGEGADVFARERGLEEVQNDWFITRNRRTELIRAQSRGATALSEDSEKLGTVGAAAVDGAGHVAAATSTGGMTNQRVGRVGDSPIIGAGTYARDGVCAVSATGHGEYFIREVAAHEVAARVRYGKESLRDAVAGTLAELSKSGGDGGMIGVTPEGAIVADMNCGGMFRAWRSSAGEGAQIFDQE